MSKIDNFQFAEVAYGYRDSGIPYSKLDCQAFVERCLQDCGYYKDWRGSNHMWRTALDWKGTVEECIKKYGTVPVGAWLFTIKWDGGEKKRGYNDDQGNAAHVGIFTAKGKGAMHSSTGGVQECAFPDPKRWTHVGLASMIDYKSVPEAANEVEELLNRIQQDLNTLKGLVLK